MTAMAASMAVFVVFGLVLGAAHFWAIHLQARALIRRAGWTMAVLPLLRFAVTGIGLTFAASQGAAVLLAAVAGLMMARFFALRWGGRLS